MLSVQTPAAALSVRARSQAFTSVHRYTVADRSSYLVEPRESHEGGGVRAYSSRNGDCNRPPRRINSAALVASAARRHLARVGGPGRPGRHRSPSRRFLLGAQPCIGWVRSSRPHRSATRERVGIGFAPNAPVWVNDNRTGLSTLYDGLGAKQALVVTIPPPDGWRCDRRARTSTLRSKHDVVPRQEWFACPRCVNAVRTRAHTWASLRRRGCCLHLRTG